MPGCSFQTYFPYPEEENAERYKQFQRQRYMERGIRAAKRECMMLQETGDTEELQIAALRLRTKKENYATFCRSAGLKQHNDRTQVYGYDRSKSAKTVWAERKSTEQYFKEIGLEKQSISAIRGAVEIKLHKSTTTNNNIWVSEGCSSISRKELHTIDVRINKAIQKMKISENDCLPEIHIISHTEMQKDAIASYNAVTNILTVDKSLSHSIDKLIKIQKDGACPDNELSTILHELFHWKDAQEYIKYHGAITIDNYNDYIRHLNTHRKELLDKRGITEYNVSNIGNYADQSYHIKDYDEVFTEIRVLESLKE